MLSPILAICDPSKYGPVFTALRDLDIRVEQLPGKSGLQAIVNGDYAVLILEWDILSLSQQPKTLKEIRKLRGDLPIVALTSEGAEVSGKIQSDEWLIHVSMTGDEKNDLSRLLEALKRFVPELGAQVLALKDLFLINTPSKKMNEILTLIDILKDEPTSVLIQGESGTGKEVIARLLHFSGRRHTGQFVAINCAAIPETLLESELFGHEKGSFTGATETRIGKFELAHKGTILLDEIGDMPLNTQAKILRILETGEIERVGGHQKIPVDIRIVAATNKNLLCQIENGYFRQDLYYRINTFTLNLPPLRERREDIIPLAHYFLDMFSNRRKVGATKGLSQQAQELLLSHEWPGNVRELRNTMERAAVLTGGNMVSSEVFPEEIRDKRGGSNEPLDKPPSSIGSAKALSSITPLEELERKAIIEALTILGNNATRAAKQLQISKATLFRKLKKYRISRQSTLVT